ncbi:MAG: serine protease AprX [Actinomycetota bacterium]|nr:serine protease AprX [Actinomycetota bacterium]
MESLLWRGAPRLRVLILALVVAASTLAAPPASARRGVAWISAPLSGTEQLAVIVRAAPGGLDAAAAAVTDAGGTVGTALPIVNGFEATVPAAAMPELKASPAIAAITPNVKGRFEQLSYDATTTATNFAKTTGATSAWANNNLGAGVGVAIIDTGVSAHNDVANHIAYGPDLSGEGTYIDTYGHGTVMAGLIGGDGTDSANRTGGAYVGMAPKATLVSVKVAGRNGVVDVSTVLQAMHWIASYKDQFNIRVVNLSWGTASTQSASLDPLNYAVERLWGMGIVVVVAAGNGGPTASTITKPADDPLVITAGAYDDKQNLDPSDDSIPSWSARGPTKADNLAKPDLVAPGRTLVATRSFGSAVESENPKALISPSYIKGSGTSEASAVTSGAAALLLAARPTLTPDQTKAVLKGSASPLATFPATAQGSGRLQVAAALTRASGPATWQSPVASGLGTIESSRGGLNVQTDCGSDGTVDVIRGEIDVRCEAWDPMAWTGSSWTGSSWTGSSWTGSSWTGSSWTGSSWTGSSWTGSSWTGSSWTGSSWTGGTWTGSSWTGSSWTGSSWTGSSWTGSSWTGSSWTSAVYDDTFDEFLTAFWGPRPKVGKHVNGEDSDQPVVTRMGPK